MFAHAAGVVTGGRLGDLFDHRRIFAIGMADSLRAVVAARHRLDLPRARPAPDWTGDVARLDCARTVTATPRLPKPLVRVGAEYPTSAAIQDAVVDSALHRGLAVHDDNCARR